MAEVFYRKWRPQRFADVVGQEYVTQTLLNALATGRVAHAYLFCGPRGTGKTSMGRILAKALNCQRNGKGEPCNECSMCQAVTQGSAMDLIEIDAASNRGIDEMRSLREKVHFAPNEARDKVYIIDEVHMLTTEAFNALLKTLEEPPPHTVFVLATTEPHRLPATVISRCQRFDFRRIPLSRVAERLAHICAAEGIQAAPEVLSAVARSAAGSLRDAENVLEQLAVGYGRELRFEQLRDFLGLGGERQVADLAAAALAGDVPRGLAAIHRATEEALDLRQFHRQVMDYLRAALLSKAGAGDTLELPVEARKELQALGASASLDQVLRVVKLFSQADLRGNSYSTLPLELALVEAATAPAAAPAMAPARGGASPAASPGAPRPAATPRQPTAQPAPRGPVAGERPPPPAGPRTPPSVPRDVPAPSAPTPRMRPAAESARVNGGGLTTSPPASGQASPDSGQAPAVGSGSGSPQLLGKLKANWKAVIEATRGTGQKFKVDALLRSGEPASVEEDAVVLAFPYQFFVDRMKDEMENPGARRALEEALGGVLGERRRVRYIVHPREKRTGHLVKAALEMGAKVVEEGGS